MGFETPTDPTTLLECCFFYSLTASSSSSSERGQFIVVMPVMYGGTSITCITQILRKQTNPLHLLESNFIATILPIFISSSLFSTSIQTISSTNTKPIAVAENPLYNLLPHTHNPNNIVNLICSNLKQNNANLTSLHKEIQWVLPHLGTDEVSRVLLRCQSDPLTSFRFFNWVKNDLGFIKPSIHNYCIIVHILTWSRKFDLVMKLLGELINMVNGVYPREDVFRNLVLCTEGCNWSPIVFDMLIKAYVKMGKVEEGLKAFKKMIKIGFVPVVSACNCLLNGLLRSNRFELCWEIYNVMERIEISGNSFTFNILTHVLCKDGDVRKVNGFLEKMEEEGFDPDVVTYNTLIESYCRKGRLDDAFYLYKIMYRRFVTPDLVTYTALMKGLCNKGKVKEAHQLFHRMINRGFDPDIVAYNSLICGYCKEGQMLEARSLLHDLIRCGLSPDSSTCLFLVEGYGKGGKLLSALNLVGEFQRLGVSIPLEVYTFLVISLCEENRPSAAKNLLRRMITDGCKPNVEIYNVLVQCFCKSDALSEAFLLKDEIIKQGLKPNLFTYRVLISCLCRLGRSVEGEFIMREMVEATLVPDVAICRALVNGFCNEKNLINAESVLSQFALEFQIFDTESYNALVKACCEEGNVAKSLELQVEMLKLGFVPNRLTCKSLINGLSRAGCIRKKFQAASSVENPS